MSAGGKALKAEKPTSTRLFLAMVASSAQVGWVVTGYSLAYAIGVPLYGRISDFLGVSSPWGSWGSPPAASSVPSPLVSRSWSWDESYRGSGERQRRRGESAATGTTGQR